MTIRTRVACIAEKEGRIVLMHKHIPSYFNFNQLTPPGGGLELGETLEEACIRELDEETGLLISEPKLRGIVSYINYGNHTQSVTMLFFHTDRVQGELITKEPEKHTPEWLELASLNSNDKVPEYYRAIIRHVLANESMLNARLEWNKPGADNPFIWTLLQ